MSCITVLWSMIAAICLTLAGMHLAIWLSARKQYKHLIFYFSAQAGAAVAAFELLLMHAESVEEYVRLLKWGHFAIWVLIISIVWFARLYLQAGRVYLAWMVVGLRTVALILSCFLPFSLSYKEIGSLQHFNFLGESISMALGQANPLSVISYLSSLALLAFLIDASLTVWRRGERRRAVMLGGGMIFFILMAAVHSALLQNGVIHSPYLISFAFLGIILAMAYELSRDVLGASLLVDKLQASEADLRESEQRLALATDAAKLGVWMRDAVKDEFWASENWRDLFGFDRLEPLVLENVVQRVHPGDRSIIDEKVAIALSKGGAFEAEYRIVLPEGETRWIASRGRVDLDLQGKPRMLRGVSVDISRRRNSELEVDELQQKLAHAGRVTMLGQLSTALAHELSQPLEAILRNTDAAELFLKMSPPDIEEVAAILVDIRKDDQRAGEVINRMRVLLRRGNPEAVSLEIAPLVSEVIALVRENASRRAILVDGILPDNLPAVRGDRVQFQQILLNLIMNGMDAVAGNEPGERRVSVRAFLNAPDYVEIAVSDNGHGIPADKLDKVFESFFTTKPNGMGIGLAISRTLIETHGGRIWAGNNPAGGATFHFSMPVNQGQRL